MLVHSLIYSLYRTAVPLNEAGGFVTVVLRTIPRHATGDITTYAVVIGAVLALQEYRRSQVRKREAARIALRASRLETQLSDARLKALQMQLHPHFLFNALNTISVLVLKGARAEAIRAIRQLGDLLRVTLHSASAAERRLEEEIDFVSRYLDIEKLRFGDRLRVELDITEDATAALVPHLILQPLIENAIVHGLGSSARSGWIRVAAGRDGSMLRLEVQDNGEGLPAEGDGLSRGVGLTNTQARLQELYGDGAQLTIASGEGGGTLVVITLPYHTDIRPDITGVAT